MRFTELKLSSAILDQKPADKQPINVLRADAGILDTGISGFLAGHNRRIGVLPWESMLAVIRLFLQRYPVDEAWYRATYLDVDGTIREGTVESGFSHFV